MTKGLSNYRKMKQKARRNRIAGDYLADHLHEAPTILMFVADPQMMAITDAKLDRVSMVGGGSVYTAVQNAMLAARTEGLRLRPNDTSLFGLKKRLKRRYKFLRGGRLWRWFLLDTQ